MNLPTSVADITQVLVKAPGGAIFPTSLSSIRWGRPGVWEEKVPVPLCKVHLEPMEDDWKPFAVTFRATSEKQSALPVELLSWEQLKSIVIYASLYADKTERKQLSDLLREDGV